MTLPLALLVAILVGAVTACVTGPVMGALPEPALAEGEVKVTFQVERIPGTHQVRVGHVLKFTKLTSMGRSMEETDGATVLYVGKFGALSLAQPDLFDTGAQRLVDVVVPTQLLDDLPGGEPEFAETRCKCGDTRRPVHADPSCRGDPPLAARSVPVCPRRDADGLC